MKDRAQPELWDERFAAGITPWNFGGVPPDLKDRLARVTAIDFSDRASARCRARWRFERVADRPAAQSLGVVKGNERWQVWKRRL
ncbi:MAG TPA: hypothetical protein VF211_07950 [Burkholderiales bacterium]